MEREAVHGQARVFSTRGVHGEQRIELWEEHNARSLIALSVRTLGEDVLDATEHNLVAGGLQFAHVSANAHVVERGPRHIARTPNEEIALYFTLFGESFFYDVDGVHVQRPGTLLVCDTRRPFMRGFARGVQELVLTVPRDLFESASGKEAPEHPLTLGFGRDESAIAPATELARSVASALRRDVAAEEGAARALDLISQLFDGPGRRTLTGQRREALLYIQRNLGDPRLSPSRVAAHLGVSERHLRRAFAESGESLARTILERRLDLAHDLLSGHVPQSVGAVAQRCGFVSAAHFTRVFRQRFEETPRQVSARVAESRSRPPIPATL